jgi:hypothetical protein
MESPSPCRDSNPRSSDSPARSQSLYRPRYPAGSFIFMWSYQKWWRDKRLVGTLLRVGWVHSWGHPPMLRQLSCILGTVYRKQPRVASLASQFCSECLICSSFRSRFVNFRKVKLKVKLFLCFFKPIVDFGTSWRWVVSFTSRPLYPQGKSLWYPSDRWLGGPQILSVAVVKRKIPSPYRDWNPRSSRP